MINKKSNQQTFQQRVAQLVSETGLPADQIILQDYDVQWLFNISRRTSFKYRKLGYFPHHKFPEGRVYFILSEVIDSIKKN
jgi:trehalose-6-phosphate synthase